MRLLTATFFLALQSFSAMGATAHDAFSLRGVSRIDQRRGDVIAILADKMAFRDSFGNNVKYEKTWLVIRNNQMNISNCVALMNQSINSDMVLDILFEPGTSTQIQSDNGYAVRGETVSVCRLQKIDTPVIQL